MNLRIFMRTWTWEQGEKWKNHLQSFWKTPRLRLKEVSAGCDDDPTFDFEVDGGAELFIFYPKVILQYKSQKLTSFSNQITIIKISQNKKL